jgi:hypothetical protein
LRPTSRRMSMPAGSTSYILAVYQL